MPRSAAQRVLLGTIFARVRVNWGAAIFDFYTFKQTVQRPAFDPADAAIRPRPTEVALDLGDINVKTYIG